MMGLARRISRTRRALGQGNNRNAHARSTKLFIVPVSTLPIRDASILVGAHDLTTAPR